MSRLVHIPQTIHEIEESIAQKNEQLNWWLDKLNRSRKNSLRSMRAMHVAVVREQLVELTEALHDAEDKVADEARCDG